MFSDGITNKLVGVIHDGDKVNMVLVRVFGENTEKFIDRQAEIKNIKVNTFLTLNKVINTIILVFIFDRFFIVWVLAQHYMLAFQMVWPISTYLVKL